jgi:hypothetical protein
MKNWKTTSMGLVLALLTAMQPLIEGEFNIKKDWYRFVIAISIGVLGYFCKDNDVTGV